MPTAKPLNQWTGQDASEYLAGLIARDLGSDDVLPRTGSINAIGGASGATEMSQRHGGVLGAGSRYDIAYRLCELRDHWQGGILWVGPRGNGVPGVEQEVLRRVAPLFVPDDAVGEGLSNVASGLLEREATLETVTLAETVEAESGATDQNPVPPSARQQQDEDTPKDASGVMKELARWWDRVDFDNAIRTVVKRAQWAGHAVIRFRVPEAKRIAGSLPANLDPADAFDIIEVDTPLPADAGIVTNLLDEREVAVVRTKKAESSGQASYELWSVEGDSTVLRIVGDQRATAAVPYAMHGRLPVVEMQTEPLITPPIIRQQALLNFMTSVLGRTVETSGFAERYTQNAEKEGVWTSEVPPTPPLKTTVWQGTTYYLKAIPRTLGAGVAVDLVGLESEDPITKTKRWEMPGVTFKEPTDPSFVTNAMEKTRQRLFQQMKQRHLSGTVTAEASGEAYEQSRAQFESHLNHIRHPAEGLIRSALESLVALASLMAPGLGQFLDRYRLQATLHIDTGPLTAAEQQNIIALRDARLISQVTAMSRARVEDAESEMEAILADPAVMAEVSLKQSQTYAGWIANTSEAVAAWLTGLTPEQATALATGQLPKAAVAAGYPDLPETPPDLDPATGLPVVDPNAPPTPPRSPTNGGPPAASGAGQRGALNAA